VFCSYFENFYLLKSDNLLDSAPFGTEARLPLFSSKSKLLSPLSLYQILLSSKIFYSENFKNFSADKSPARLKAGGAEIPSESEENLIFSNELKFVPETTSAQTKPFQTFSIILPNLIHKSRKKDLKK